MGLIERLKNPERKYTPVPFWFLNGDLKHEEIRAQLRDFDAHGVHGVVLHPRMGVRKDIGYLSAAFFSYLRTAVREAERLDMQIILYDEGMYPSGAACGQVVQGHPEFESVGLGLTKVPEAGDTVLCRTPEGTLVMRKSGGTIRGIHYGEDDGEANAPKSADILNPDAVRRFISLTHDAYARELGAWFGKTIIGMFTDEPDPLGRNTRGLFPWTPGLEEVFREEGGDLSALTALFRGEKNTDTAHYERLVVRTLSEVYYGQLRAWCDAHGIALMGHPAASDDIEVERVMTIPGQDLVYRWVAPEKGGITGRDSVLGKCSADAAFWQGAERNLNECFGACGESGNPWHMTGAECKWWIDYLAVRGVNLFIPHAFYYSLKGKRSGERPPDVGPGSLWWPSYHRWADYMARLSCLMTEGEVQADIALMCRNRDMHPEAAAQLFTTQRGFRYVPESLHAQMREVDGEAEIRGKRFRCILGEESVLPGVSHDFLTVPPDLTCDPPASNLRAAKLRDGAQTLFFVTNEGLEPIRTRVTLPAVGPYGWMDLWTGETGRIEGEEKAGITLELPVYGSLLLFTCTGADWDKLPEKKSAPVQLCASDFQRVSRDEKAYTETWEAHLPGSGAIQVCVDAEEVVEAYIGEELQDVSFWGPHTLRIPESSRRDGETVLRLVIRGSLANRYGKPVPYGMRQTEQ
ncbi:MAG: hypothetical protein IJ708_09030 [Clostridia bacterium]|nr:hypothetical protein [Clostridia bacterium]